MDTRIKSEHKVNWTASLSNGETFFEGKGIFEEVENELSPFQKLIKYTAQKEVFITSFGLYCGKHTYHLPSTTLRYKIGMLDNEIKPIDYRVFRYIDADLNCDLGDEYNLERKNINYWWTVA